MSKKSAKIAALIESCQGEEFDAHYLGYFKLFNDQLFYESHDVLEELWLLDRKGPKGDFYKGLIQLAGAFVHLQKERMKPSFALFTLAENNLVKYPARFENLDLAYILRWISEWKKMLESEGFSKNPLSDTKPPRIELHEGRHDSSK